MKYTVLVLLPCDIANDQATASETVARQHVNAGNPDAAYDQAVANLQVGYPDYTHDEFAVIAVFRGHLFDHVDEVSV